jgi:hypothetical protein
MPAAFLHKPILWYPVSGSPSTLRSPKSRTLSPWFTGFYICALPPSGCCTLASLADYFEICCISRAARLRGVLPEMPRFSCQIFVTIGRSMAGCVVHNATRLQKKTGCLVGRPAVETQLRLFSGGQARANPGNLCPWHRFVGILLWRSRWSRRFFGFADWGYGEWIAGLKPC